MSAVPGRAATISWLPMRRVDPRAVLAGGAVATAAVIGALAANHPAYWRLTLAVAFAVNLIIVASRWPRAAVLLTLSFLPLLAMVRRLLIQDAGWTQYDPLLLVGPLVAIFLIARIFLLERRELAPNGISKLVVALLVLMLLQSFNPMLGSLTAGAGGFMFLGIPLLWFFVGREIADRRLVLVVLYCAVGLAVAIGAYGLWQTEVAMPSWDTAWVNLNGYEALSVYGVTRAFGTFSSSAEYGIFLGVAVAISAAMLVHRRAIFALTIPFLVFPLFLASGRGVIVLAVLATLVAAGLRTRNTRLALLIVVAGLAVAVVGLRSYGSGTEASSSSSNPLVTHQVSGLTNPLDPEHSTLLVHADLVVEGVKQGFLHPFGQGTAVTNIAADRFGIGSTTKGTEVDVSNAFVSLGLVGGLLFLAIVIATFRSAVMSYLRRPDPAVLAVIAFLIVTAGQWLNGGFYALAPLTWFFIGWATSRPPDRV